MEHEASAIARKVRNYIVLANESFEETHAADQDGIFKNIILISLMGAAVACTQLTLFIVKLIKKFEG